jgi:hypothetical protein
LSSLEKTAPIDLPEEFFGYILEDPGEDFLLYGALAAGNAPPESSGIPE